MRHTASTGDPPAARLNPARIGSWRDIRDRLRANARGYLGEYRVWLAVAALATLADLATTIAFMRDLGPEAEVHPGVRLVSLHLGPWLGPTVGKAGQFAALLLLTIYLRPAAKWLFGLVIVIYTGAAVYNLWVW